MSNDINRWYGNIRLTKDPELRFTQGGTPVCSFSGASNYSYGKGDQRKESVSFFSFIAWGKSGEVIAQYGKKGNRIGIEGRLQQRSWQDNNGQKRNTVEIVVENFQFLEGKGSGRGSESEGDQASGTVSSSGTEQTDEKSFEDQSPHFSDDDIPF